MDFKLFFETARCACLMIQNDGKIIAANESARNYKIYESENLYEKLLASDAVKLKIIASNSNNEEQQVNHIELTGFPELLLRSRWKIFLIAENQIALICEELCRFSTEDFLLHTGLMKRVFDYDPNLITITNKSGMILFANLAVYKFSGLEANPQIELLNKLCQESELWLPGRDYSRKSDTPTSEIELTTNLKGDPAWFENLHTTIPMQFGEDVYLTISKDVSNWKRSERKLLEYQESLSHNTKISFLGEMTAQVAHEINNPLTIILGNSDILKDALENIPNSEDLLNAITRIESMVSRITKIIKIMRGLSRDNVESTPFSKAKITDLIIGAVDSLDDKFKAHEITIKKIFNINNDSSYIDCLPAEISQIFLNLLLNAVEAINLNIKNEIRTIEIEIKADSQFTYVSIIDSGIGLSAATQGRIFEPFFTTKQIGLGSGLGLSISKKIANIHKGDLYLESSQEGRTVFVVKLPLS